MPDVKPVLHHSQLAMLSRCPMQYEFRYVKGIIIPPAIALLTGTATHAGVEANLKHKAADPEGGLLPAEHVVEAAVDCFKAKWEKDGYMLDDEEQEQGVDKVKGDAIDTVAALSNLHHRDLAPIIYPKSPEHVERTWRLELKGYPVDLAGTIDIQEEDAVRDTKTAKRDPGKDSADKSEQLTVYALAVKALDGKAPEMVVLDNLIKKKQPEVKTYESKRDDADFKEVLLRVARAVKVIESGAFFPTDPSNWACSKKFCGYWSQCPHGAKGRVQV